MKPGWNYYPEDNPEQFECCGRPINYYYGPECCGCPIILEPKEPDDEEGA